MKIAIFTDTFSPDVNGVARTLQRLTEYLQRTGIEYKVFAPDCSKDDPFQADIYRFASLPFLLYPECRLAVPNMLQIRDELLHFKPDLIHIVTPFNIGLAGLYYAKKLNIPLVGSYHTNFDQYLQYYDLQFISKLLWKYVHWFYRPFQKIFVPSRDTMEFLKRKGFTNLYLWGRGVNCQLFHSDYDKQAFRDEFQIKEKYLLTYVGRLAPEKNVSLLIQIDKALPDHIKKNIRWLIIGEGPSKRELMKSAPSNMTFAGFLKGEKLAHAYASSDLFVFPSTTETFGNVVLESLACATPVIGANAGGVKNIIKHQKNGILCEPENISQFVHAIVELIDNESKRKDIGYEGRAYALTQSWDSIFENLLQEYEDTIKKKLESNLA